MTRRSLSVLVLVLAVAGCGGSSDAKGPTATVGSPRTTERPTTTTAKPATPEAEVEAAYLKSWDVYAKAVRSLDLDGVEGSYADEALATLKEEVRRHKDAKTYVVVRVDHDYRVQVVQPDRAVVVDRYVNHSIDHDQSTGEPVEPDPNKVLVDTYTLRKYEGLWKVSGFVRQ